MTAYRDEILASVDRVADRVTGRRLCIPGVPGTRLRYRFKWKTWGCEAGFFYSSEVLQSYQATGR